MLDHVNVFSFNHLKSCFDTTTDMPAFAVIENAHVRIMLESQPEMFDIFVQNIDILMNVILWF